MALASTLVLVCCLSVSQQTGQAAQFLPESRDFEQEYLDGLRKNELYVLLETYCRERLARDRRTAADEARYTIELSKVLALRADVRPGDRSPAELWLQAADLLTEFLKNQPEHPQASALQFQIGFYQYVRGEMLRLQSTIVPGQAGNKTREQARQELNRAASSFKQVAAKVLQQLKTMDPKQPGSADRPGYRDFQKLQSVNGFRLAHTYLSLARMAPENSVSRTQYASDAVFGFEPLTVRYSPDPLVIESFLAKAECQNLLGDYAGALASLSATQGDPKLARDPHYDTRRLVLKLRIQMDQPSIPVERTFAAIDEARKLQKSAGLEADPELDLLFVESALGAARVLSNQQNKLQARQLVQSVLKLIDNANQRYDVLWSARCELLLADLADSDLLIQDPLILIRVADGLYRRGELEKAVAMLDQAAKMATNQATGFDATFKAASIQYQQRDWMGAATRFSQVAEKYKSHERAFQADFNAVRSLGLIYSSKKTRANFQAYEKGLENHVKSYQRQPTGAEAAWLLGSLRMSQKRWRDAIQTFRLIASDSPRFGTAQVKVARAFEFELLAQLRTSSDYVQTINSATRFIKESQSTGKLPSENAVDISLIFARMLSHQVVAQYESAEAELTRVLFELKATEQQKSEARRINLIALVGQQKFDDARNMLTSEVAISANELLAVIRGLQRSAERLTMEQRQPIGGLQIAAVERIAQFDGTMSDRQKLEVDLYEALGQLNAGKAAQAEKSLAAIRAPLKTNLQWVRAWAQCKLAIGKHIEAREAWLELIGLVQEGSDVWFEGKLQLATVCLRSRDAKQCIKIIDITSILHPELGGPEMKARFEKIRSQAEGREN